jgi:hypothetical protein
MITCQHMDFNTTLGQLIKKHFLGSFQGIKVYILPSVKGVPKNENSINAIIVNSGKESILIELLIEI